MSEPKKKSRQYSFEYLKYGFISSPGNSILPMCLLCNKTLSNDSMKPSKLKEHLMKIQSDKTIKIYYFFKAVKEKYLKTPSLQQFMGTSFKWHDDGLRSSYNIFFTDCKVWKAQHDLWRTYFTSCKWGDKHCVAQTSFRHPKNNST